MLRDTSKRPLTLFGLHDSLGLVLAPNGVGYAGKPIDCKSLHRKQNHSDLDDNKLLGLRNDAERNDESRRSRGWMTYPQKGHERASSRKRERSGQQPCAMDTGADTKRRTRSNRKGKRSVPTDESNCVPQDGITRAGDFSQWGKEKEIRCGAERWEDKWASSEKGEQAEQSNGDEAVYADIDCPHQTCREVLQEPFHTHAPKKDSDMLESVVLSGRIVMFIYQSHQILGRRSKYSSSSFLPPSPRPTVFSDSMNSIRSIHLTIL